MIEMQRLERMGNLSNKARLSATTRERRTIRLSRIFSQEVFCPHRQTGRLAMTKCCDGLETLGIVYEQV